MMNGGSLRGTTLGNYQRREMDIDLNLTIGPPDQTDDDHVGSSLAAGAPNQQQNAPVTVTFDFDDEVLLSSARAFDEARNNSRRVRETSAVVDIDLEEDPSGYANWYKRQRSSSNCQPVSKGHVYINLESSGNHRIDWCAEVPKIVPPPSPSPAAPPPLAEPAIGCPICMGELVEEMTTKCGHIFCKKCIDAALSRKSICPTCRKKVNKKDIIRIYLPRI